MKFKKIILSIGLFISSLTLFSCFGKTEPEIYKNFEEDNFTIKTEDEDNAEFLTVDGHKYKTIKPRVYLENYGDHLNYKATGYMTAITRNEVFFTFDVELVTNAAITNVYHNSYSVKSDWYIPEDAIDPGFSSAPNILEKIYVSEVKEALETSTESTDELELRFGMTAKVDDYIIKGEETIVIIAIEHGDIVVKEFK